MEKLSHKKTIVPRIRLSKNPQKLQNLLNLYRRNIIKAKTELEKSFWKSVLTHTKNVNKCLLEN